MNDSSAANGIISQEEDPARIMKIPKKLLMEYQ